MMLCGVAMQEKSTANPNSDVEPAAYAGLLERLLTSPQLKRSARLRELLTYIWRRSVQDHCDQIHEQEIGTRVFGRQPGYDTAADNIVRVSATDLRKRLESYFADNAHLEPIVVEIPRGNYTLQLRPRAVPPPEPVPAPKAALVVAAEETVISPAAFSLKLPLILSVILTVLLGGCCLALYLQNRTLRHSLYAWKNMPAVHAFWSEIFDAPLKTDIVLADPSFALIEDITNQKITLSDYLNRSYLAHLHDASLSPDRQQDLDKLATRNLGSLGDFHVAIRLAALDPTAQKTKLFTARSYSAEQLKANNVILIGSRKSNPWVDLYEDKMNFVLHYDISRAVTEVENRKPRAGEQTIYSAPPGSDPVMGYAVIAYLRNPDQKGKVLLIEGSSSEATAAAGDFLTSEEQLKILSKIVRNDRLPYFEVLLKTSHVSGTPLNAEIIAVRSHGDTSDDTR
jgi:hypothetical protein